MHTFGRLLVVFLGLICGAALGQPTSSLNGSVSDENGAALPAATITLTGADGPATQATNGTGQFRFQGLAPGDYRLVARVEGFDPVSLAIAIRADQNAITIRMRAQRE
jgi:protocatechuate 3,4-dioxygenase beta subunit